MDSMNVSSSGLMGATQFNRPPSTEIGFRITEVDGGFFIQNFDVYAGNAVRSDLDGVQTYVAAMLANKFTPQLTPQPNAPQEAQINEVGVEAPAVNA